MNQQPISTHLQKEQTILLDLRKKIVLKNVEITKALTTHTKEQQNALKAELKALTGEYTEQAQRVAIIRKAVEPNSQKGVNWLDTCKQNLVKAIQQGNAPEIKKAKEQLIAAYK